jgi:class 3 adenylate cyclase
MPLPRLPALSFRAKLVLAMVLLVGGVSVSTLYVARLALQHSYAEALQQQFRSQIEFFVERQNNRLAEIKELGTHLASSTTLQTALAEGHPSAIYAAARSALMTRSTPAAPNPAAPERPATPDEPPERPRQPGFGPQFPGGDRGPSRTRGPGSLMAFLRVLDARGNLIRPEEFPTAGRGGGPPLRAGRFDDQLAALTGTVPTANAQEVGYLAPANDTAGRVFLEVVTTPVVHPAQAQPLGAVVLGAPLFDGAEEMRDLSDILAGFWLEGQLHTHTIPEPLRAALTTRLRETARRGRGDPRETDFQWTHAGETYRVFLRLLNSGSTFPLTYQVKLYSLASALRTERHLQSVILSIGLLVLASGIGISLLLANRLTLSVRELDSATSEVLRGNFQVRVPVRSRDDVGRLVDSFNQMTDGLAQKERYRRVLNLVTDADVATQLVGHDWLPAGESREVTVLFCDVRQFTTRTRGLPPSQVIALLNEHMTGLTQVVYAHQGIVDKFVGDLIMAVFGAPRSDPEAPAHAVACARRMLAVRAEMNRAAEHPLEIGIGLATGPVVAGLMGSADRANYTVLGGCVNLASRLCAEARPGQILLDATTCERLGEDDPIHPLPPLALKGFPEPVPAWECQHAPSDPA